MSVCSSRVPFKVNAYMQVHDRLHLDLPQVDFYFYEMKSTCSACLKSACDNDSQPTPYSLEVF